MKNKLKSIKKLIKLNSFVRFNKISDTKNTTFIIEIEPNLYSKKTFYVNHYQFVNLLVYVSDKNVSFRYDFSCIWF